MSQSSHVIRVIRPCEREVVREQDVVKVLFIVSLQ